MNKSNVEIAGNSIRNARFTGIELRGQNHGVTVVANTVAAVAEGPAVQVDGKTEARINNNFLTGNRYGIAVWSDHLEQRLDARFNDLSANMVAIHNRAQGELDARLNWFGTTDPSGVYGTLELNAPVLLNPWLATGNDIDAAVGFQPDLTQGATSTAVFLSGSESTEEGFTYPLTILHSDVNPTTISIDWGDGEISSALGQTVAVSHIYADGPRGHTIVVDVHGSLGVRRATTHVTVMNSPPTLDPSVFPFLNSVERNNPSHNGTSIRELLARGAGGDPIDDLGDDAEGIAVVKAADGLGIWQFSLDGGGHWLPLGGAAEQNA